MARGSGSASVLLILVVLLSTGIGAVVIAWWPLTDAFGGDTTVRTRRTTATVVQSASCAERDAHDLVELTADGDATRVPFDGCGHSEGTRLRVRVPEPLGDDALARPVDAEHGTGGTGLSGRLGWVLLVLAALSGAGYVLLLRSARPGEPG